MPPRTPSASASSAPATSPSCTPRAVKKCPGAKLVGLWNRGQDRAKQRAAEFGCKNYATPEALVQRPGHRRRVRPHQPGNAPRIHEARARRPASTCWSRSRSACRSREIEEMKRLADAKRPRLHAGAQLRLRRRHDPHARTRRGRRPRQDRLRLRHVQHPPPRRGREALPRRRPADPHAPLVHPALSRRQAGRTVRDEGDAALQGVHGGRHRDGADAAGATGRSPTSAPASRPTTTPPTRGRSWSR